MSRLKFFVSAFVISWQVSTGQDIQFHSSVEAKAFSSREAFDLFIGADEHVSDAKYRQYQEEFSRLLGKVAKFQPEAKSYEFVKKSFYWVHRKSLKWYKSYGKLSQVLSEGNYDCVTGTALLALIYDHYEVAYTIYEFDTHVLMMVHSVDGDVLLESTDPFDGVVYGAEAIQDKIEALKDKEQNIARIFTTVNLQELAGLQYYNIAASHYSNHDVAMAMNYIHKAESLYPCERIVGIREMLENKVENESISYVANGSLVK